MENFSYFSSHWKEMKTLVVSLTLRPIWCHFHISVHEWSSLLVMATIAFSAILSFSDLDHFLIAILRFYNQNHFWTTLIQAWRFIICKVNCALLDCWNNTWEQNMKLLISAFQHSCIGWLARSPLVCRPTFVRLSRDGNVSSPSPVTTFTSLSLNWNVYIGIFICK